MSENLDGIILKGIAGFYYIDTSFGIYECKARGIFRKNDIVPTVGDKVKITVVDEANKKGNLIEITNRKNQLIRPAIANVDNFIIVSSVTSPPFDFYFVDKLLVICEYANINPVIIINKNDLDNGEQYGNIYEKIGYKVLYTSAKEQNGVNEISLIISNGINVLSGASGVGKSSLINLIDTGLNLETGEVSKLTRGRHTTRHSELFKYKENSYIADTPGFSSFEIDFKIDDLGYLFKEFRNYKCMFLGCTHTKEKGCKILEAVSFGDIANSRYTSYLNIYNKIKDIKHWHKKGKNND